MIRPINVLLLNQFYLGFIKFSGLYFRAEHLFKLGYLRRYLVHLDDGHGLINFGGGQRKDKGGKENEDEERDNQPLPADDHIQVIMKTNLFFFLPGVKRLLNLSGGKIVIERYR